MIVTGSPDSLTRVKTTSETTKIDTIDCSKRPIRYRCTTSGLEDLDGLGQNDQDYAPAFGRERVLTAGWRVEVVTGLQMLPADLDLALEDQDLFSGWMVVGRESRAGREAHDGGRSAGRGIPAQHLDRHTLELQGAPVTLAGPDDRGVSRRARCTRSSSRLARRPASASCRPSGSSPSSLT